MSHFWNIINLLNFIFSETLFRHLTPFCCARSHIFDWWIKYSYIRPFLNLKTTRKTKKYFLKTFFSICKIYFWIIKEEKKKALAAAKAKPTFRSYESSFIALRALYQTTLGGIIGHGYFFLGGKMADLSNFVHRCWRK